MTNPDYLIFAMASGETSQAYSIAKYFISKGKKIDFVIGTEANKLYFSDHTIPFPYTVITQVKDFLEYANKIRPKHILFCNSKSFKHDRWFLELKPKQFEGVKISTLDSNWLFNSSSIRFPYINWANRYFINFPKKLFDLGLKKNGGYFQISNEMLKKIQPVGFIPYYKKIPFEERMLIRKKLNITEEEKLIFCYFSGFGAAVRSWVLDNLVKALEKINNKTIKVLAIGDLSNIKTSYLKKSYLIHYTINSLDDFYRIISSTDLIFQHQGLATLAQGLAANIPIIANVSIYEADEFPGLHPGEINPFKKLGLCEMFYKHSPIDTIANSIKSLLFDSNCRDVMMQNQSNLLSNGEESLFNEMENT